MKKVGIIIVAHKGRHYVEPLLKSLAETIQRDASVIWVLDNASTDGTPEEFEQQARVLDLPLRLIRHGSNAGYMAGNNLAYAALRKETPCETIVLLNLDIVVHPGWLEPLMAELQNDQVGTAVPLLLLPDGTVNTRGNALHFLGLGFVRDYGAEPEVWGKSSAGMFFGSSAALAFRTEVLERLNAQLGTEGIFWDDLFLYADDSDLGWRMRLIGRENRLVASSRVTHDHRFWINGLDVSGDRLLLLERNRYLLLLVNFKIATLLLLPPWIVASEIALAAGVMKLYPRRLHLWREVWREARRPGFRERRRGVQAGRLARDREILRAMTGSIRHGALPFGLVTRVLDAGLRLSHGLLCAIVWW